MKKVFRDPVHNLISFDDDIQQLILELICTPEMQRLRRIKQLGLSYIVYPGADHSRFSHSLGVAYLVQRMINALMLTKTDQNRKYIEELENNKKLVIATALLHDTGHGPFSHAIEHYTKKKHEKWTIEIIENTSTQVNDVLKRHEVDVNRAKKIILRTESPLLVKLVSSQLDADRFDYLLRDSILCGVEYGRYDLEWILHSLRITTIEGLPEIAFDVSKGKPAVEGYILARFWMYQQVYLHKATLGAERMIVKILERAALHIDKNGIYMNEVVKKLLGSEEITINEYQKLDDTVLLFHFHEWQNSSDGILADLCRRFFERRLPKAVELDGKSEEDKYRIRNQAEEISKKYKLDPQYYIFLGEAKHSAYKDSFLSRPSTRTEENSNEREASEHIFVVDKGGTPSDFADKSDIINSIRNKGYNFARLYMPDEVRKNLEAR